MTFDVTVARCAGLPVAKKFQMPRVHEVIVCTTAIQTAFVKVAGDIAFDCIKLRQIASEPSSAACNSVNLKFTYEQ
jgi:hypothetical protein